MQSPLMTSQYPEPPFDPDVTNPSNAVDNRIRKMQETCIGRPVAKTQHGNRLTGAHRIVEQGCAVLHM